MVAAVLTMLFNLRRCAQVYNEYEKASCIHVYLQGALVGNQNTTEYQKGI